MHAEEKPRPPWFLPCAIVVTGFAVLALERSGLRGALRELAYSRDLSMLLGDLSFAAIGGLVFAGIYWLLTWKERQHRLLTLLFRTTPGRCVLAGLFLLVLAYPASQGPAVYAMNRGWISPGLYFAGYGWLIRSVSIPEPVYHLQRGYVQWWSGLARPSAMVPLAPITPAPVQPAETAIEQEVETPPPLTPP